ncbi:DUF5663 domain-containing protein [Mycolicibacterium cosmeticum]|uniref:DUF5663 domain-containing protein n=1 Tax=Mycolicibacterium cosmeticum TaxID=258533 RepID=UPI003204E880
MTDLTAADDVTTSGRPIPQDLVMELAEALPDLTADELESLSATVFSELELRVGQQLTDGLSNVELEEFSALVDAGDEQASTAWLAEHRPDYQDVVAAQRGVIVAETVTALGGTSSAPAVPTTRRREEILDVDIDMVAGALRTLPASVVRVDDRISVAQRCANGHQLVVIASVSDNGLLIMQSAGPSSFSQARKGLLLSFAQRWNRERYWPKAFVVYSADGDTCRLVAEIAYPLAAGVHRRLLAHLLGAGLAYTKRMFESLTEILDDPEASAQLELF